VHIVILGAGASAASTARSCRPRTTSCWWPAARTPTRSTATACASTGIEERTYRVRAATSIDALPPDALIVLTTKVVRHLHGVCRCQTPAAGRLNDLLRAKWALQRGPRQIGVGDRSVVLRAITHFGAIFRTPGVVELEGQRVYPHEQSPRGTAIADAFTRSGLDGQVTDHIKDEMWQKVVVNCVINPVNAITRAEVGAIADERLRPLKQ